jgi:hypothetical protein
MPTDPSIKCPQLYKALKRDGYSKSDAAAISNGLWRKGKCTGGRKEAALTVTKDAKGEYRWTLISSSAYVDRDGEIVTEEALERAVEKMKATGEYGNLLWWHTPIVLGKADFAMVHAHQLLESGTFASKDIAQKVEAAAAGLGASIGFGHTPDQPRNKEYHDIAIKERSLLPRGKESNLFTRLRVAGGSRMKELTAEKRAGLVALLGEDEANAHIAVMERTAKEADGAGVTRKEAAPPKGWFQRFKEALAAIPEPEEDEDGDDVNLEDLAEDIEAEAAALAEEKAKKKADKAEDTDPDDMPMTRREVKAMIAAWEKDAKKEAETVATKAEVAAVKEVQTTTAAVITELTNTVKGLEEQLKEVRGEQPRVFGALFGGSRPSADSSTKTGEVRDVAKEQGGYKTPVHAAVAALDKQG